MAIHLIVHVICDEWTYTHESKIPDYMVSKTSVSLGDHRDTNASIEKRLVWLITPVLLTFMLWKFVMKTIWSSLYNFLGIILQLDRLLLHKIIIFHILNMNSFIVSNLYVLHMNVISFISAIQLSFISLPVHTFPFSSTLVSITITAGRASKIICQKLVIVSGVGPEWMVHV